MDTATGVGSPVAVAIAPFTATRVGSLVAVTTTARVDSLVVVAAPWVGLWGDNKGGHCHWGG